MWLAVVRPIVDVDVVVVVRFTCSWATSPDRQYFNINPTASAMTKCGVNFPLKYLSSLDSVSVSVEVKVSADFSPAAANC